MQALNPNSYTSNTPMIRALASGEIDVALTNHYYVYQLKHGGAEGGTSPKRRSPKTKRTRRSRVHPHPWKLPTFRTATWEILRSSPERES